MLSDKHLRLGSISIFLGAGLVAFGSLWEYALWGTYEPIVVLIRFAVKLPWLGILVFLGLNFWVLQRPLVKEQRRGLWLKTPAALLVIDQLRELLRLASIHQPYIGHLREAYSSFAFDFLVSQVAGSVIFVVSLFGLLAHLRLMQRLDALPLSQEAITLQQLKRPAWLSLLAGISFPWLLLQLASFAASPPARGYPSFQTELEKAHRIQTLFTTISHLLWLLPLFVLAIQIIRTHDDH